MRRYIKRATKNNCYKAKQKMTPVGILVHSTGAVNKSLKRYVDYSSLCGKNINGNHWNVAKPDGVNMCVHAFIGEDKNGNVATVEILPLTYCAWGCGSGKNGSYNFNPAHIQFEICEGAATDRDYFERAWTEAVEYCAYLCQKYKWDSSKITSHKEASCVGYASGHTDPFDYFAKFGEDMDMFRSAVQQQIDGYFAVDCKYIYKSLGVAKKRALPSRNGVVKACCVKGDHYLAAQLITPVNGSQKWFKHLDGTYSAVTDTNGAKLFERVGTYTTAKANAVANVRAGAGINNSVIGKISPGETAYVVASAGTRSANGLTWVQVVYNGQLGWVDKQWIT